MRARGCPRSLSSATPLLQLGHRGVYEGLDAFGFTAYERFVPVEITLVDLDGDGLGTTYKHRFHTANAHVVGDIRRRLPAALVGLGEQIQHGLDPVGAAARFSQ